MWNGRSRHAAAGLWRPLGRTWANIRQGSIAIPPIRRAVQRRVYLCMDVYVYIECVPLFDRPNLACVRVIASASAGVCVLWVVSARRMGPGRASSARGVGTIL